MDKKFWRFKNIEISFAALFIFAYTLLLLFVAALMPLLEPANYHNFFDGLWWAIVTATTVGYGDVVPHTAIGKGVAIAVIVGGVVAVAAFTALMTTALVERKIKAKKEYEMLDELNNHLVICGFKSPREEVLASFKSRYGDNIVIIYPQMVPELKMLLEKHHLKWAKGEYNDEAILKEAHIERADKVMILNMHDEYGDARVLETVIVIRSLNPNVYITAEIIDPKYENYLLKSRCNEIIMSEEYNRFLLSRSVTEPGMSKVIRKLLRTQNIHIRTKHPYIGQKFADAFNDSLQKGEILLGFVKNYITEKELKKIVLHKLRFGGESEKYKKLLAKIKRNELEMEVVINPDDETIIPEFAAMIVMERRHG